MRIYLLLLGIFQILNLSAQEVYLSERLQEQMLKKANGLHHIQISLKDKVDVYSMDEEMRSQKMTRAEKVPIILKALQEKANVSQKDLLEDLKKDSSIDPTSIRSYWISNVVYARVSNKVVERLAKRNDILMIDLNGQIILTESYEHCEEAISRPDNIEPGLDKVNAPELWKLGYTGRGGVVFGADTGIQETHPALNGQYRGLYFNPTQTWYDWDGELVPSDCGSHGNHTLGTVLGIDRLTNDTIGMAPNATFIGAKILCGGIGTEDNVGAFQWALDPDGDPNTIDDLPDVINNSWRDPQLENECTSIYVDLLMALEAVGVSVIFSAGNEGPEPSTITKPHNINYDIINNFVVGALDGNTTGLNIADFSSRGPSLCGGDSSILIKPEVSAPGVGVRSCALNGEYILNNGTSMAAPHVAGAILLLREAFPQLGPRDYKSALYFSARDLGQEGEDNVYGMGIIDVKAAYDFLIDSGYEPADPSISRDAVLYHIQNKEYYCEQTITPKIYVENLGTAIIESLEVDVSIPEINFNETYNFSEIMMPKQRKQFELTAMDLDEGVYDMTVTITKVNGEEDQHFFNNRLISEIIITDEIAIEASVDQSSEAVICEGTGALLTAAFNGETEGDINFEWYDDQFEGNLLGEGSLFSTPALDRDSTFYAEMKVVYQTGEQDNSFSESQSTAVVEGGITFDAAIDFKLKSVTVYTQIRNIVSVVVIDENGENLVGDHYRIEQKGKNIIELDYHIPAGNNYSLEVIGITPLEYNLDGANFPYEIDGVVTLTGNTIENTGPESPYYCFYDWEIEHNSVCGRTPVEVKVSPAMDAPVAYFSSSDTLLFLDLGATAMFADSSLNAVNYEWNFGDGTTVLDEQNPSHQYQDPGNYQVILTVENNDGCQDFHIINVTVKESSTSVIESHLDTRIDVFPNPTNNLLYVQTNSIDTDDLQIEIHDLMGKKIASPNVNRVNNDQFEMELFGLEAGAYLIMVRTEELAFVTKIIKL